MDASSGSWSYRRLSMLIFLVASAACSGSDVTTPTVNSLRCEFSPVDGTPARRGTSMSVVVTVLQEPADVGLSLSMGVEFTRPDGVVDNSFLPGVTTSRRPGPPMQLEAQFSLPIGTPEGNPFIPAGSRLKRLWAEVYMQDRNLTMHVGATAVYPVSD